MMEEEKENCPTVDELIENVPEMQGFFDTLTEEFKEALEEIYTRLEQRNLQGLIDYFEPVVEEVPEEDGGSVFNIDLKFNMEQFDADLKFFTDF